MTQDDRQSILLNPSFFHEEYFPTSIIGRESQLRELELCLMPARQGKKPLHAWLFGGSGSGKTTIAKHFLQKLEREAWIKATCINCWEYNSHYAIVDKLTRDLRILGADKLHTTYKMERLQNYIGKRPLLIFLDEIDRLPCRDRNGVLYNLCAIENAGLFCISACRAVLFSLEDRVKSRLSPKLIEFSSYSSDILIDILKQRANLGLNQDVWDFKILEKIAAISEGNARVGIQVLKNAAYNAENERSDSIEIKHINHGFVHARNFKKKAILSRLTSNHRVLYELIKENKEIESGKLWKLYLQKCSELDKKPIALRTYSEYMNKLIELDLIKWERALVRGKVRIFRVNNGNGENYK
jgi:cell division control protein 6